LDTHSKTIPYFKTKTQADILVRRPNTALSPCGHSLLTATLRLPMIYGERDRQYTPSQLATVMAKQTNVQLGNGKNLVEPVYIGNAAMAHLLAAKPCSHHQKRTSLWQAKHST
jgi:nucleoside-diphosphate-sugar epimerase